MTWHCEHPLHVGSRTDVYITDRLERRVEYRRKVDDGRFRVVKEIDLCRTCCLGEIGERNERTMSLLEGS